MVDGLHSLGHHTIIGGHHQDGDVGELGATRTHGGEGLVARGVDEGDLAGFALKVHRHLIGTDALGDAAGLALDDVGLADRVQQSGLTVIDMAHDGDDRRTRLEILVLLKLLFVQIDIELLQQLLVFLLGGHQLDVPADFLAKNLEGGLVKGLRGRGHLAEMEHHSHQGGRIHIDLLGQIGKGRTLTQTDGLAIAVGDAHAADGRSFDLLKLATLRQPVLAGLRRLAALTTECAGCAATAATTA